MTASASSDITFSRNEPDLIDRIWTELDIREEVISHCPACAERYAELKKLKGAP